MEDRLVKLKGMAKAASTTGCGTPGIYMNMPSGNPLIPSDEFCEIIRYFLTNTDFADHDPRLKLIDDIQNRMYTLPGFNEGARRVGFKSPGESFGPPKP